MARPRSFDRLARGVVASVLALVDTGCGGLDLEGMEAIPCRDGTFDFLGDLRLANEVDSLELFVLQESGAATVVSTRGTRCGSATDAAACQAAFDVLVGTPDEPAQGAGEFFFLGQACDEISCFPSFLVATRGDEVFAVDDVVALLAPIDTPSEVVWMAVRAGYELSCGNGQVTGVREAGTGWEMTARYHDTCTIEVRQELFSVASDGTLAVLDSEVIFSNEDVCIGRRPGCPSAIVARGTTPLGARLAGLAQLEAESVPAFAELAQELAALGAPRSLIRRARRARRDEVRHARVMIGLARRHGGAPTRASVARPPPRALLEVAIANAREGCVREAFGAVVGRWQALHAQDPAIRAAMQRIARDEATHAGLALAIDTWARRQLGPGDRARLDRARVDAIGALIGEIDHGEMSRDATDASVSAALGLPSPAEARLLLEAFARAVPSGGRAPAASRAHGTRVLAPSGTACGQVKASSPPTGS